jgi:hypothetical protein
MTQIENDENKNEIDDHEEATTGMEEVDAFDFERAVMLMSVMEKVANVAPKSAAISGLAAAALNEINEEAKAIAKRRAEAFKDLERQRDERLAAQRRERDAEVIRVQEEAERDAEVKRANVASAPHVQAHAPTQSKTDQVARDNMRRA